MDELPELRTKTFIIPPVNRCRVRSGPKLIRIKRIYYNRWKPRTKVLTGTTLPEYGIVKPGGKMLHLHNVTKRFAQRTALAGLNLAVSAGQIYVLLGPNGAGKTTTLKVLSGLTSHDSGTIQLAGKEYDRQSPRCRGQVAYVPDQPFLYSRLTGDEHLHFYADLYGVPEQIRKEKMDFFFRHLEFEAYRHELVEHYSTGTRQKLLISQALLVQPELLLLDEPLVSVDPLVSRKIKELLQEEALRGTAILFATHLLSLAEEIATRIGIIVNGRIHRELSRSQWMTPGNDNLEALYVQTVRANELLET